MVDVLEALGLGFLAGLGIAIFLFLIAVVIAVYVYTSLAWMTIAKKLRYRYPWLAWIPFANMAMILQLGNFHWAWVFLILIPFLGWLALAVLGIIANWRIFEKREYPGWFALVPLAGVIPFIGWVASAANLVIIGVVAWVDRK